MDMTEEEKRLQLENKKLAREVKRLTQDIALLRAANEQAAHTQENIQKGKDRQMFYIEQVMKTTPQILILTDDQMRTVLTSDVFFQYNDAYEKSELHRGIPLRNALTGILAESELDAFIQKCVRVLGGETIKPYIERGVHQDGRQRWRVTIRRMEKSDIVGLCVQLTDTTEIVDAMERAKAADKAKSSFVANMSHEIRTPINAILGLNEMILRESAEPDTLGYAADIQTAGRTLLSLVNDILDFSKMEEGRMEILPAQYELSSLINDLVNMTRTRASDKGLHFRLEVQENIPEQLFGDEIRIRQCALNILTNAVKYTEKGSVTLSVGCEAIDGESILLKFSVADTGIGLKAEDMEKLFTPFKRIEEERNRFVEGTGLGMSITKQLLDLMGSRLEVESIYGEGSTFSFALRQSVIDWTPVRGLADRAEGAAARRPAYHEAFRAPDARVLVVDDMPVNLTVVKGLLKRTQLKVDTAASGREAIEKAARQRYDVVFVDHMMPGMDGVETLQKLKEQPDRDGVVYIALTANAVSGSREKYLAAGFSDYLSKPLDSAKLEEMLMAYLPWDKVLPPSDEEEPEIVPERSPDEGAEEPAGLPDCLFAAPELDVPLGLRLCGTEEIYLDTVKIYAQSCADMADEIEACFEAGDVRNTVVKVHAVKSASRVIGAKELGALAEKLEMAGKAGEIQTLRAELGGLLARYRALGEQLAPLVEPERKLPDENAPLITDERLQERYDQIRELMDGYEFDRVAEVIESFASCRVPEEEQERVARLRRAADNFEWELINSFLPPR